MYENLDVDARTILVRGSSDGFQGAARCSMERASVYLLNLPTRFDNIPGMEMVLSLYKATETTESMENHFGGSDGYPFFDPTTIEGEIQDLAGAMEEVLEQAATESQKTRLACSKATCSKTYSTAATLKKHLVAKHYMDDEAAAEGAELVRQNVDTIMALLGQILKICRTPRTTDDNIDRVGDLIGAFELAMKNCGVLTGKLAAIWMLDSIIVKHDSSLLQCNRT